VHCDRCGKRLDVERAGKLIPRGDSWILSLAVRNVSTFGGDTCIFCDACADAMELKIETGVAE
jgi:hypothetical protein